MHPCPKLIRLGCIKIGNRSANARQAFWDGEAPEIIGSRFEEIAAYIDLEENL